jgi:hypothetical protein
VQEIVSLRDLPATIVDLVGLGTGAPFPGRSLASLWRDGSPGAAAEAGDGALSELANPLPNFLAGGRSPTPQGSLISLAEGDFVYIRNDGDGTEQLFDVRNDPRELTNRARDDSMRPVVERSRARLDRMISSPSGAAR